MDFWGSISALARAFARLLTSTPEPVPREVTSACAAALAVLALAAFVVKLFVLRVLAAVLVVEEVTLVTMMGYVLKIRQIRY